MLVSTPKTLARRTLPLLMLLLSVASLSAQQATDRQANSTEIQANSIPVIILGLGKQTSDVGENDPPRPLLVASSIPNWRRFRDDRRPWLTIHADGKVLARPNRKELAMYETRLPAKLLRELTQQIRELLSEELKLTSSPKDVPAGLARYGSITTLAIQIDGKQHAIGWYRSDDSVPRELNDFYDRLFGIHDAAETGGYDQIASDQKMVDAELPRLGMHDGIKDVDPLKVKLSSCQNCHESTLDRAGWRWWDGTRFNRWSMEKVFEVTVRQQPGQKPFIETMEWRTTADPAKPLRGWIHDAYTNQPLKDFRIIAGTRRGSGWDSGVYNHNTVRAFTDGTFEYQPQWGAGEQYVRIEADGYYPEPLPLQNATVIVRLRPEDPYSSTVVDVDGNPVEGATCALLCPDRPGSIRDGTIKPRFPFADTLADRWRRPAMSRSDQFGQFSLPEDPGVQMVAAADPEIGLGMISNRGGATPITLSPWATLAGCFNANGKPSVAVTVRIKLIEFFEPGDDDRYHVTRQQHLANVLDLQIETKSDERGRWLIEKLPAGTYQVTAIGSSEQQTVSVKLEAGKKKNVLMRIE